MGLEAGREGELTKGLEVRLEVRNQESQYHHKPAQHTKESENFKLKFALPGSDEGIFTKVRE